MSNMNKEKGTVVNVTPLQVISDKFRKQEFTIKTEDEKFAQFVTFQLVNDKCEMVSNLRNGNEVEVSYNLRGREWTSPEGVTKYFNTVEAWSVILTAKPTSDEDDDDLPF